MSEKLTVAYLSFPEAQRLIPIFDKAKRDGPYKEARESAARILMELKDVRDLDYGQLGGKQIFLRKDDYEFLLDVLGAIR